MGDKDRSELGVRQKELEHKTRHFLPAGSYTMIRVDGKSFHSWCRGLQRPYDMRLVETMRQTMLALCERTQDCVLGYCQSDEITLILAGYSGEKSQSWFDGNLLKNTSIPAGTASAHFNHHAAQIFEADEIAARDLAVFDGRAWAVESVDDVLGNLVFRIRDAERNSASMLGQAHYSPRQLHGVSRRDLIERLEAEHGVSWDAQPGSFRSGSMCIKRTDTRPVTFTHKRTGELITLPNVERSFWSVEDAPRPWEVEQLRGLIPPIYTAASA